MHYYVSLFHWYQAITIGQQKARIVSLSMPSSSCDRWFVAIICINIHEQCLVSVRGSIQPLVRQWGHHLHENRVTMQRQRETRGRAYPDVTNQLQLYESEIVTLHVGMICELCLSLKQSITSCPHTNEGGFTFESFQRYSRNNKHS